MKHDLYFSSCGFGNYFVLGLRVVRVFHPLIIPQMIYFLKKFFYYSYMHTRLGSFLPTAPTPSLTTHSALSLFPPTPSIPGRNYFALISNFIEERV
jgi:hypothetical protein